MRVCYTVPGQRACQLHDVNRPEQGMLHTLNLFVLHARAMLQTLRYGERRGIGLEPLNTVMCDVVMRTLRFYDMD
jgi:hypothetical protein